MISWPWFVHLLLIVPHLAHFAETVTRLVSSPTPWRMTSAFHKSALTSSLALGSLASGLHSLLVQMCNVCGLLCVILEELSCFVRVRVFSIPLRSVKGIITSILVLGPVHNLPRERWSYIMVGLSQVSYYVSSRCISMMSHGCSRQYSSKWCQYQDGFGH